MTDDAKTEIFMARVNAGARYAGERWDISPDALILHDAFALGQAMFDQGLDGANQKAAELEAIRPQLRRRG